MAPEYLSNLRAATREAHESLETLTQSHKLIEQEVPDREVYQTLLTCHYLFHKEVARHVEATLPAGEELLDWPACNRIPALKADLEQLGVKLPEEDVEYLPVKSYSYAVGLCYVSEGSCLGNQQMLKVLSAKEEFNSWNANNFFLSCREGFGQRWRSFMGLMDTHGTQHYSDLEAGGIEGFELFKKLWLTHYPAHQQQNAAV